jgi:hypothetical protein
MWNNVVDAPRYLRIGIKNHFPAPTKTLQCNCPVCSAIKYQDIFSIYGGNVLYFMTMAHNIYSFDMFIQTMFEIFKTASKEDVNSLLKRQLSGRFVDKDEIFGAISLVDSVAEHGLEAAEKRYKFWMPSSRNLFSMIETPKDDPDRIRYTKIFNSYISGDYLKNKKNTEKRVKTGHKAMSVKAIKVLK